MSATPSPESLRRAARAVGCYPVLPFPDRAEVMEWLEELAREQEHSTAARVELDRVGEAITARLDQKRRKRKARQ